MAAVHEGASSAFDPCSLDDAPLPPVSLEDPAESASGVASMIDSPFASSLIAPGLMEQLSQSIAGAASSKGGDSAAAGSVPDDQAAARTHAAAAAAPAGPAGGTASAAAKETAADGQQLQGVASILESPFSRCLDSEVKHLNLGGADGGSAAAKGAA